MDNTASKFRFAYVGRIDETEYGVVVCDYDAAATAADVIKGGKAKFAETFPEIATNGYVLFSTQVIDMPDSEYQNYWIGDYRRPLSLSITLPKEFGEHYMRDKFADSFSRLIGDIKGLNYRGLSGNYEIELLEALADSLKNARRL